MWAWAVAMCIYLGFRAWYDNWRGRLSPAEIADFVARARTLGSDSLAAFEGFLAADDGRDFIMLNLVRIAPGMIPHPDTGAPTAASEVLARYSRPFLRRLLLRGGHPAWVARPAINLMFGPRVWLALLLALAASLTNSVL